MVGQVSGESVRDLSTRELAVLHAMAYGCSNKEIASHLSINESTVKTYATNIFNKIGVRNRTEAVASAVQSGLVRLDSPSRMPSE